MKIIIIKDCLDCPLCEVETDAKGSYFRCTSHAIDNSGFLGRSVRSVFIHNSKIKIPKWCKLSDIKDGSREFQKLINKYFT